LFVILTALAAPLWRLSKPNNQVRPVRLRTILALAVVIAALTWLTWQAVALTIGRIANTHRHVHANFGSFFGVPVILISLAMLFAIVGTAELAARVLPARLTPANPPVRSVRAFGRIGTANANNQPQRAAPTFVEAPSAPHSRELGDQRAQLHAVREPAAVTLDRLLERLEIARADIRSVRAFGAAAADNGATVSNDQRLRAERTFGNAATAPWARKLADQHARLPSTPQPAEIARDQLLERLETARTDIRTATNTIAKLAGVQS
jgi:hypothetical protein